VNSIPPSEVGGNLDINELGVGSTLYLPIQVKGALFYTGDPHFAQGDGEVALTALEASLRATFRLTLLKKGDPAIPLNDNFKQPFAETKDYWIPVGLDPDLDEAMKEAVRESIEFLSQKLGMDRAVALAYLSAATDYEVSQVVDKTKGVHALIARMHFLDKINIKVNVNGKTITPLIFEDEVFVPIRSMSENLGGIVEWEGETQTILVKFKDKTITMKNNSNIYMLDGKAVYSKGGPIHTDNLTMVPITVISDILGANVTWSTSGVDVTANVMLLNSK
jgi:hypothetical protein